MLKYLVTLSLFASVGLYDVSEASAAMAAGAGAAAAAAGGGLVVAGVGTFSVGAIAGAGTTAAVIGGGTWAYCKIRRARKGKPGKVCAELKKKIRKVPKFVKCVAGNVANGILRVATFGRRKRKRKKCRSNQNKIDDAKRNNKECIKEQVEWIRDYLRWCRRNPGQCSNTSPTLSSSPSGKGRSSSSSDSSSSSSSRGRGSSSSSSSSSEVGQGGGGGGMSSDSADQTGPYQRNDGAQRRASVGIFGFDQYMEIGFILMSMMSVIIMVFCIKQSCFQQSLPMVYTASSRNQKTLDMEY